MHIFIVFFMLVVIRSCLRYIGSSPRYRREYRKLQWERQLAEIERKRETDRNVLVFMLKAAAYAANAIAIFGQSLPYFLFAGGLAIFAGGIEVVEQQRRATRRGEQRRNRELLMQAALERAAAEHSDDRA